MSALQSTSVAGRVSRRLAGLHLPTVLRSALAGGLGGVLGWALGEWLRGPQGYEDVFKVYAVEVLYFLIVSAAIGTVLGALPGILNRSRRLGVRGAIIGSIVGGVGGGLGALPAQYAYQALGYGVLARAVGWAIVGTFIGLCPGVVARDRRRALRGLIGGCIGGFVGGVLFEAMWHMLPHSIADTGTTSRFAADVAVGACIGSMVALVEALLKDAWLGVLNGRREGAQFILSKDVTCIGTDDRDDVILWGDVLMVPQHARIRRSPGGYLLETLSAEAATATHVNGRSVTGPTLLSDGDKIILGATWLLFHTHGTAPQLRAATPAATPIPRHAVAMTGAPANPSSVCADSSHPEAAPPSGLMPVGSPRHRAGALEAQAVPGFRLVGSGHGERAYTLPQRSVLTVGRDAANDIVIIDATVSGRHAELRWEDRCWVVCDMGSTNGTYVSYGGAPGGERRVQRNAIQDGSIVRFGEAAFRLERQPTR